MKIKTYRKNGYHVLHFVEEVSMLSDINELKPLVEKHLKKKHINIAARFSGNPHLSSYSIAVLVTCNEKVRDKGGVFAIINIGAQVGDFLATLGIEDRFELYDTDYELGKSVS